MQCIKVQPNAPLWTMENTPEGLYLPPQLPQDVCCSVHPPGAMYLSKNQLKQVRIHIVWNLPYLTEVMWNLFLHVVSYFSHNICYTLWRKFMKFINSINFFPIGFLSSFAYFNNPHSIQSEDSNSFSENPVSIFANTLTEMVRGDVKGVFTNWNHDFKMGEV